MKVAVVSDIHGNLDNVKKMVDFLANTNIELLIILGDLTNSGSKEIAEEILDLFSKFKILAVPGNMDSAEIVEMLEQKKVSIHKKTVTINGFTFIGLGGAKPVNTFYRTNLGELEAKKELERLFKITKGKVILLMHCPPSKTKIATTASGVDLGLNATKEAIEKWQPIFCFFGHVHEAKGETLIGKSRCINPGALKDGNFVVVDLESGHIEWVKI